MSLRQYTAVNGEGQINSEMCPEDVCPDVCPVGQGIDGSVVYTVSRDDQTARGSELLCLLFCPSHCACLPVCRAEGQDAAEVSHDDEPGIAVYTLRRYRQVTDDASLIRTPLYAGVLIREVPIIYTGR